ncbi:tandem C2 domains nuclear protein isoform X2 [Hypanus sabinus]|uniref:tandem C2 domains nuclear protein isoform X2 n=1 Tax=Hypanus sabinus TaxID=79690 RepID=UPI0028C3E34B|nr:tandem C2 domains nuclear protein isoform X2 [Hypanus sabinus]
MAAFKVDPSTAETPWLLVPVFIGLLFVVVLGISTEFLKDCCKEAMKEKKKGATKEKTPETATQSSKLETNMGFKKIGFTEDFLLAKLPPNGKEVPFVVPNLRTTYIQPNSHWNNEEALSAWELRSPKLSSTQSLSSSMSDLSSGQRAQRYSSTSSLNSNASSLMDSLGSSRSLDGFSDEFGKLNLRLSYRPDVEQIWITVVQIKDLYLYNKPTEKVNVYLKGTITIPKPVQFKSSVKDGGTTLVFMETFVFSIKLPLLQTHGLVIKVVTQQPRKRVIGECAMSLRELCSVESDLWLSINPLSKIPPCHALLRVGTCFQAVSNRVQLQVLEVQNLPSSSLPLTLTFYVKIMMETKNGLFDSKKTRPLKAVNGQVKWGETFLFPVIQNELQFQRVSFTLKLYSKSSVRRKQHLGQVVIGWDSTGVALEQWQDTSSNPEKIVVNWHNLSLT